jgi:hypothetical protein
MKKIELQKVLIGLAVASIISLAACNNKAAQNQQSSSSSHEMKIENVNEETGSFDIVDARTKKVLSYNKIMINNQNVVSTKCMSMMDIGFVIFNYDKVSSVGKEIANIGIREDTPKGYELTEGVLNIIVDNLSEASDNATVKKEEEKPTIKFKGGTCVYKSLDYSSEEKRLSVILNYRLDENASTAALTALDKGVIETSEGKTYKLKESLSNSEYSLYRLDYYFPDAIQQDMSFKYVLNEQEIPISFF